MPDFKADRAAASTWAKSLLDADPRDTLIFDTETSDLYDAEILELGLIYLDGTVALEGRVCPYPGTMISEGAFDVHGLTLEQLREEPPLSWYLPQLSSLVRDKTVLIYNRGFDWNVLVGCLKRRGLSQDFIDVAMNSCKWYCVMLQYAAYCGEWNRQRGAYRWQRLPGGDHSAIGDCRATLDVLKRMAGVA